MTIRALILAATLGLIALNPIARAAQTPVAASSNMAMLTEGEVRKIDPTAGKITIKHGPIVHMDMPGMTMVFTAKDKALLENIKVGDKVRFMVSHEDGKMLVTEIQLAS